MTNVGRAFEENPILGNVYRVVSDSLEASDNKDQVKK
jgi:hypothetical protein